MNENKREKDEEEEVESILNQLKIKREPARWSTDPLAARIRATVDYSTKITIEEARDGTGGCCC